MMRAPFLGCLLALSLAAPAQAQPVERPASAGAEAYQDAVRWRNVDTTVEYLDPLLPLPSLEQEAPEPRDLSARDVGLDAPLWVLQSLVIGLLAILLLFLYRASRGGVVRFGANPGDDGQDDAAPSSETPLTQAGPLGFGEIRADPDRRAATIALLRLVLPVAADANDLRLHPSWTVRDALSRIPQSWSARPLLAELARAAEEAHFGDYPVTEDRFALHLAAAEQILATGRRP